MNVAQMKVAGERTESGAPSEGGNVEVVRRGYHGFNTADVDLLIRVFHEQVSWHTPGQTSIAGDRQGRDTVFTHFGRYGGETAGTFRADVLNLFESDDGRVVGLHRNTGVRNGKHLDVSCCIVVEIKDGRILSGTEYFFDLYAWDAFWS
jgi:ketosteroid isomerase-like protein